MTTVRWVLAPSLLAIWSCASTTVIADPPDTLTGTYVGRQEGTHAGVAFQDEVLTFSIVQTGDSVSGTWEITNGASGVFEGAVTPSDTQFEFSMEMDQTLPCSGAYSGSAEAQVGIRFDGSSTLGIAGSYLGDDCGGDVHATFFVVLTQ
jgi:hypothetical protein